ncbi:hypothetical protein [Alistipes sp. ZOR0009]|uniref:hypothetical protein n=1 Tax=Alistipes sp. ZOR0009 TaxID=1339253 RepID=UPI000648310F|nr:hypothetical protein [Alistipes sp. ZOR0009]
MEKGKKGSRFATMSQKLNQTPIVGEDSLSEARNESVPLPNKNERATPTAATTAATTATPPVLSPAEIIEDSLPIVKNFDKTIRITAHYDSLLDIFYALNKDNYKSKAELLDVILGDFFGKKENKKYVDLKNNK